MKEVVYAIGDIHGQLDLFEKLIAHFDENTQQLVLIGDLADRGLKGKQCYYLGMDLVKKHGAIYLKGNHEAIFLNFLKNPEYMYPNYVRNGGRETLESFFYPNVTEELSPTEMAMMIRTQHKELVKFLNHLPMYYEWKNFIFVHAGVDLSQSDWHNTQVTDFNWIREPFIKGKNNTGKTIVFGHTITPMLYGDMRTTDLWISDNKIGIDGGGVFGGSVHGVIFDKNGIVEDIEYKNETGAWQPKY
ncbi:MAG: metallophosphoesterase [Lactobacillales bacterium]|jgi:serine/threonine protein phosphatase 1|nr:metallophosphoesterase [Lactobacillales bacterium]